MDKLQEMLTDYRQDLVAVKLVGDEIWEKTGFSPNSLMILACLAEEPTDIRRSAIAKKTLLHMSVVVSVLQVMEKLGLVGRVADRKRRYMITVSGIERLGAARARLQNTEG